MDNRITNLMAFLDASPSVYHAVANIEAELKNAGYCRISEAEDWKLVPGGKYYVNRGGSSVMAFRVPAGEPKGFMMSASHSDRPCFKIKENGELVGAYTRLATERYGGMLIAPWLDRPLSIAGRMLVETEEGIYIGASQADVEKAYGAENFNGKNAFVVTSGDCTLTVILENGVVNSIQYNAVIN